MFSFQTHPSIADAVDDHFARLCSRLQADYDAMPGLSLKAPDAARLCGVPVELSQRAFARLEASGYLKQTTCGYVRVSEARSSAVHQRWEHLA